MAGAYQFDRERSPSANTNFTSAGSRFDSWAGLPVVFDVPKTIEPQRDCSQAIRQHIARLHAIRVRTRGLLLNSTA